MGRKPIGAKAMTNAERQKDLRGQLEARSALFSARHFVHQMRELVERFEPR